MPTTNQLRLPPILDENLFEDFCRDLWALIWGDPDAERNGRKGQSQCGVDVFGMPAGTDGHEGVQAKAYGRPLNNSEIQHEIDEAKKFTPPLRKLIIACTGPRDAKGQAYVRQLNVDHRRAGLFKVTLLGWDDIKGLVQKHLAASRPDLVAQYFELTTTSGEVLRGIEDAVERAVAAHAASLASVARVDPLPSLIHQEHYHAELNYARDLVNGSKPEQALEYLASCRERFWSNAEPPARYRILHYQGCSHYLLDHMQQAGRDLMEALQYNPDDETALAFAALGGLLLDDRDRATDYARRTLEKNPSNAKAYATLLRATAEEEFGRLVETVPEPYRSLPEVANALAVLARQKGDTQEAERWCRLAIEQDREDWADLHGLLGEIIMARAFYETASPLLFQLNAERRQLLEAAEAEFSRAWERVKGTGLERGRASWLANRGMARLFVGKTAEAREDFDAALRLDPTNPAFIQRRASLAAQEGDTVRAIELMQSAPHSTEHPEAPLILAEMLLEASRYDEAERSLDRVAPDVSATLTRQVERVRLRIAIAQEDWPRAKELYAGLSATHPEAVEVMADGAWLARRVGDDLEEHRLLAEATRRLTPDSPLQQVHILAAAWYERRDFRQAAALYGRIADRDAEGTVTRRLLICLHNAGEAGEALRLARHMLSMYGPQVPASEVAAAILEHIGDLPGARQTAEEYLALFPNDFHMRLHRAWILHRSGETEDLDKFLDAGIETARLPLDQALRVASLYADRGRMEQALGIAYEARRRHPAESEAHRFYASVVFAAETSVLGTDDDPAVVGLDTAVCIRDDDGREEWHVIEERDDHNVPQELPPGHPLAQKLIGLAAGARVIIKQSEYSTETAVITAVQSKYVYAIQETMRTFERMFPETPGMWKIKLPTDPDSAEPDLNPFLQQISRHHEHCLAMERLYREGKFTLGMLARATGGNLLAAWSHAVSSPEVGVRCCLGTDGELGAAKNLLSGETVLVLDPISLLTIHSLESRDALAERFGKFLVPQSTPDMLRRLRQESQGIKSDGYMTVGKLGNQFVRQETTAEDIRRNIGYIEGLLAWISKHCLVTPVLAALESRTDQWKRLSEMLLPCFVDSVLIASDEGRLLYSDDERLRALARHELGREGIWTQVLLAKALDEGLIDEAAYSADAIRLSAMNYNQTYFNPKMLTWAAHKAEWKPVYPFTAAVRVLSEAKSNVVWALAVTIETIYNIWSEPLMEHQRSFLLNEMLSNLCQGRDRAVVLGNLRQRLQHRFYLLPLHFHQVDAMISLWGQTHLI